MVSRDGHCAWIEGNVRAQIQAGPPSVQNRSKRVSESTLMRFAPSTSEVGIVGRYCLKRTEQT